MNSYFKSREVCQLYENLKKSSVSVMLHVNDLDFSSSRDAHKDLSEVYFIRKSDIDSPDEQILNDLYVLNQFILLLLLYSELWESVLNGKFSDSWSIIQDALDTIRSIKKFSKLNLLYFEEQLIELEKTYPYNIFLSIGATVEKFECSICGLDIDSTDCVHRKGELYSGLMAIAIAKNLSNFDHVAMVLTPEDKRCVVTYEDNGEQFKLVRYLSSLISNGQLSISDFKGLNFTTVKQRNPEFIKQKRNEKCNCGSGKKFKKCCISAEYIDGDHVDVIAEKLCVEHTIA